MLKTLRNAWKIKEIRTKLIFTFLMLVVIRFGSELPIPGVKTDFFANFFANQSTDAFGFFNAMTGGSFSSMSIFALSITPYITSSIIMQLLTIAIPKLEEMQRDGEDGRKKIAEYTRYLTVGLALIESIGMAVGFGGQGLLINYNVWSVVIAVATMTAGSAFLMWIGERITEKGVGNGISIVLLFNIVSSLPQDVNTLYTRFLSNSKNIGSTVLIVLIMLAVTAAMVVFVIILQDGERRIPVQYSKKMVGRKLVGMQLLTIAIPKLEEMQRDGEDGRKKIAEYTRYLTVGLALIESIGMAVGFGGQGLLINYNVWSVVIAVATMTAGSAFLMWIGERITEKGVGNGISIVLLFNIVSSLPQDVNTLYTRFLSNSKNIGSTVLIVLIMLAVTAAMVVFVIILQDGERRIPVQYSKKMVGRKLVGGQASHIPLKVNTAGVIPVIFASSIMSFPIVIAQFFHPDYTTIGGKILMLLNSSYWFRPEMPAYSVGLVIYLVLIVLFAYFYTSITFNPLEVANNMKKSGGFIPGVRPGKPTSEYLDKILNYIVFIGAVGLIIVSVIPIIISGVFTVSRLSFMGTSLIIIVSVILETIKAIESQMIVRNYKGFLND